MDVGVATLEEKVIDSTNDATGHVDAIIVKRIFWLDAVGEFSSAVVGDVFEKETRASVLHIFCSGERLQVDSRVRKKSSRQCVRKYGIEEKLHAGLHRE